MGRHGFSDIAHATGSMGRNWHEAGLARADKAVAAVQT
jgi:hypothetical protein